MSHSATESFVSALTRQAFILIFLATICSIAHGRDAFVMLSGGYLPWDNNFSQYLQARAMTAYFERNYSRDSVWVFFGAGNVEGQKPIFCDVRRDLTSNGVMFSSWFPGALSRNRAARRDIVLRAFRDEILPAVAEGGTLYLFVGDHGSQNRNAESVIDLWSVVRDASDEHGWRADRERGISVSDLREVLAGGLGRGRVVFCMTQCHSGGFHFLGIPRAIVPNPKWFTTVPSWVNENGRAPALIRAAGFTATDERSLAAGCTADPDPERWAGYERFVPEHLLGLDLFTLRSRSAGLGSFAAAHAAAVLVDETEDKPYSTSDQYLERWATLIEKLANEKRVTSQIRKQAAAYQRAVDKGLAHETDRDFQQREKLFWRFTETLAAQNASAKNVLLKGSRHDLELAIGPVRNREATERVPSTNSRPRNVTPRRRSAAATDTQKLWNETLRPAWAKGLDTGAGSNVVGAAYAFEKHLLSKEARGTDYFSMSARERLFEEAFWEAGYSDPEKLDRAKADAVMQWATARRVKALSWLANSRDAAIRSGAEKLLERNRRRGATLDELIDDTSRPVSRRIAAERVLFYRRVLAAWQFLLAAKEKAALQRLQEIIALESSSLPPPTP